MKRKILGLMMAIVAALPVFVNAEEGSVKIGETIYPTLKEAVEAVEVCTEEPCETTTITVLKSHESSGIKFASGKYLEIDLGGFTVTFKEPTIGSKGTETQDIQILKNSEITFKNGKLVSSDTESSKMFIQNYADLTLKNVEIDATNELNQYALSNNSGTVSMEGTTSIKATKVAFDVYGWYTYYKNGPQVTVNTTGTIEGTIEVTADSATPTTALSLVIKNMNHVGEIYIQEGLESNVIIKAGSYTDENAAAIVTPAEGSVVYPVRTEEGLKYVVATEDDVVSAPYEAEEALNAKEVEEALAELEKSEVDEAKELAAAIKKALEGKVTVSAHSIFYGKFLGENIISGEETNQPKEGEKVAVTLNVPETLEKVKDGFNRKYSVIRIHYNEETDKYEVDVLEAKANEDGTVTFETDKFSTYFLAYEDVKAATNPDTFDGISLYMIIASVSLIGLVSLITYVKKAKSY